MIKKTTHILDTSSCTDFLFTSLPNLIIDDSSVHSSLHPNCHYQLVYGKFNLEITDPFPSCRMFGTTKMLILYLFKEQLTDLIRHKPIQIRESMRKLTILAKIFSIFSATSFNTKN